jgi:hypothetical protein
VEPQPASITLVKAGEPAMIFRQVGAGAVLYLGTDEMWRWRFQVADLYHQRLWMQLAAWIAAPPFPDRAKAARHRHGPPALCTRRASRDPRASSQ